MTPTFLTMAYTDAGLWRELDILFTGFFCVGTALAVLPFFWSYLLFGIVLLALLPLELSSVLGTGLPFNYGFLKIIMASYPREYLDAIMAYSGALIAFLSAMLLYFVLLFLYVPKRLRICWKWSPLIICALFGIMVASYWTVTAFSGTTKHYADYNRSYLGVAKVAVITSFPLKYLLLFYAHQTAKEIENHVIRERLGFIDTISVTAEKPDSIVGLFFIGETSRACNWQLAGYHRMTNPILSKRKNVLFFPDAFTVANHTAEALKRMIFPTTMDANLSNDWCTSPMLMELAKKAFGDGSTVLITNQNDDRLLGTGYFNLLLTVADRNYYMDSLKGPNPPDQCLLPPLAKELEQLGSKSILFTLWGRGGHWFYPDHYTNRDTLFTPCNMQYAGHLSDPNDPRIPVIRNAFDNTILHTDRVIDSAIAMLEALDRPSFLIYLADHGENIYDTPDMLFFHASKIGTHFEAHIPFLIWYSTSYEATYPEIVSTLNKHLGMPVSLTDAFHTAIQLLQLNTPWFDPKQSLASDDYLPHNARLMYTLEGTPQPAPPYPPEERARIDSIIASFH